MAFDYWDLHNTSELELRRDLCWDQEPPKARAPPKQSEGFGARHQHQISWLLVPLPLRSPKDMRRERPHPRVMQSNPLARQKVLPKGRLSPVHPVACGLAGSPQLLPPVRQLRCVLILQHREVVNRCQHLQLCHRSPWDHRQVWRCLRSMLVCVQSAFRLCPGTLLRWRRVRFLSIVVNPGEFFEILVCDQAGVPSATCDTRLTRRWPSNATGWFVEVQCVGCSDPSFGQLLAQMLPPTRTGVLHVSSSISSPDREVVHSDTLSVVASAMLPAQFFYTAKRGAGHGRRC